MAKSPTAQAEIGLVFTEEAILAVAIHYGNEGINIAAQGLEPLPRGVVDGAGILNPQVVVQALRKLRRDLNLEGRFAAVALPDPGYSMRALRLPDIPPGERRTLVRGELEEMGALPFGGGAFDFLWVSLPPDGNRRQADSYAFYTSDVEVETLREVLRLAGFQMASLEPMSLTMMRAYLAALPQRQPIALLCPAEKHSDLCIHDGRQVRHLRRIPAGWAEFARQDVSASANRSRDIEQLSGSSPLRFAESEETARAGAPFSPPTPPVDTTGPGLSHTSAMDFLVSEVTRSLAFYAREYREWAKPEALVILSPTHIVDSFRSLMAGSLPIPLVAGDSLAAFDVTHASVAQTSTQIGYLAAIGAALGDIEQAIPLVDVSQQETAAKTRRRAPAVLLAGMAASTVWMVLSAVAAIALTVIESNKEAEINRLTQEINTVKAQRNPLLRYQQISAAATSAATATQVPASAVMGRLAASTTPGIQVTNLHVTSDGKVTVEGDAVNATGIERFASRLGIGRSVQSPVFEMMKQNPDQSLQFRIAGRFRAPAPPPGTDTADSKQPVNP